MRATVALLLLVLGAASPVLAGPRDAQIAKNAAYKAFEVSDYDTAIAQYKKAYQLTSDPRLFYNLGLSHRKRFQLKGDHADLVEARDYFHRFVTLLDPAAPAHRKERARLEKMRALAKTYIDELETELNKPPPEPPPAPDPAPAPAPPAPVPPPAPQPAPPAPASHEVTPERGPTGTILLVTASALAVGGGVTGVLALRYNRDAKAANALGDVDTSNALGDKVKRYTLLTDVMIGTAVVAGTIGLYLGLTHPSPRAVDRRGASVSISPFGAALVVRY